MQIEVPLLLSPEEFYNLPGGTPILRLVKHSGKILFMSGWETWDFNLSFPYTRGPKTKVSYPKRKDVLHGFFPIKRTGTYRLVQVPASTIYTFKGEISLSFEEIYNAGRFTTNAN